MRLQLKPYTANNDADQKDVTDAGAKVAVVEEEPVAAVEEEAVAATDHLVT